MRVVAVGAVCVAVVVLLGLVLGAGTGRAVEDRERASATTRHDAFPDALGASALAGELGAPVVATPGDRLAELLADRVSRRAGANRFATAAATAATLNVAEVGGERVVVLAARSNLIGSAAQEARTDACRQRHIPVGVGGSAALSDRALHTAAVALARCGRPATSYTYDVVVRGEVVTDPRAFAEQAATILADERGWALDGELGFAQVADDGDVTLVLASPDAVAATHPICGRRFSCRVGDEVVINDRAWREATPAFRRAGGDLATYRRYVLQHELGHWLGYGHRECPQAGRAAPVMQQQSISLDGCTPQGWPLADERATARDDHVR